MSTAVFGDTPHVTHYAIAEQLHYRRLSEGRI